MVRAAKSLVIEVPRPPRSETLETIKQRYAIVDQHSPASPIASPSYSQPSSSSTATFELDSLFPRPSQHPIVVPIPQPIPTSYFLDHQRHRKLSGAVPYRSSRLVASTSLEKLMPARPRKASLLLNTYKQIEADRRSSSDVDLDLSFELNRERSSFRPSRTSQDSVALSHRRSFDSSLASSRSSPILPFGTFATTLHPDEIDGQLTRSASGHLTGIRRSKARSSVELRAAYAAGEEAAEKEFDDEWEAALRNSAIMDEGVGDRSDGAISRMDWIRRGSAEPERPITRNDFLFHPIDPLFVPLLRSPNPATIDYDDCDSSNSSHEPIPKKRRAFPMKLVLDKAKKIGSPLTSPNWSMGTYLNSPTTTSATGRNDSIDQKAGTDYAELARISTMEREEAEGKKGVGWIGSALGFLTGSKSPASTNHPSPLFSPSSTTFDSPPSQDGIASNEIDSPGPAARVKRLQGEMGVEGLAGLGFEFDDAPARTASPDTLHDVTSPSPVLIVLLPPPNRRMHSFPISLRSNNNDSASTSSSTRLSRQREGSEHVRIVVDQGTPSPPRPRNIFLTNRPKSFESRFSFVPAPLTLATTLPLAHYSPPPSARRNSFSNSSIVSNRPNIAIPALDEILPAKLFFVLGFFFGPCFWLFGAFWLRSLDGELWSTGGQRCRSGVCSCGKLMGERSRAHGAVGRGGGGGGDLWGGVDQWVWLNRAGVVGFVNAGFPLIGYAIFAVVAL